MSYDITNSYDIFSGIKKANQAMGVLNFFWQAKEVDVNSKYQIYMAIPLNLLLGGCKSRAMMKYLMNKLEVFHMICLRIFWV